jgi:REP element-mobilizing transposase RayT
MSPDDPPPPLDPATYVGYFDPSEPIGELSGNLPHWRQDNVTYFVTFRLADSIPQATLDLWVREREDWLIRHPEPRTLQSRREYYRLFVERFQKWLDAGYGECVLGQPAVREIVAKALRYFETTRYILREWVIMPNHVHAIVTPLVGYKLSDIFHSWKSYTANQINRLLKRTDKLWQKEPFDHIIRDPDSLERIERYIHDNPRGLPADRYTLHCLREGLRPS